MGDGLIAEPQGHYDQARRLYAKLEYVNYEPSDGLGG